MGGRSRRRSRRCCAGGCFHWRMCTPPKCAPHRRAELLAHIQNTNSQYNLPQFAKKLDRKSNRIDVAQRFEDPAVRKSIEVDITLLDRLGELIRELEAYLLRNVKVHDPRSWYRLQSVPGIGEVLALVMLYEIQDIGRFPTVQQFCSYAR